MNIDLHVDTSRFEARFRNPGKKLKFAAGISLNRTLVHMQKVGFDHIRQRVVIRNERFFFGTAARPGGAGGRIEVKADATKDRLYGVLALSPSEQSSARRTILPELERGGVKKPRPGSKHVAAPITGRPARPSFARGVPPAMTFAGLKFRAFRFGKLVRGKKTKGRKDTGVGLTGEFGKVTLPPDSRSIQWKGLQRAFILGRTQREPEGAVFQRFGPARGDIREVYSFETDPPLPDALDWEDAVSRAVHPFFEDEMDRQFQDAFEHERSRGRLLP